MSKAADEGGAGLTAPFRVDYLRVDGKETPLGLDQDAFRFSWRLAGEARGLQSRTARIWVATERRLLDEGEADVWDSGPFAGESLHADYAGPRLQSASRYWWKVAVWNEAGERSDSKPARFDTGLFPEDWKAQWIWRTTDTLTNDYAYFRKEIEANKRIAYAKLFMSAHNVAQVFVNGTRIGGYGSPAPTNPDKRKYYLAYDVTAALRQGSNCLSAIAHYLGGSGQNYVNGVPGFRLQLEAVYEDGTGQRWTTDTTWETLQTMPRSAGMPYQQNRRMSAIDDYDARKLDPAWQLPGFDKSACRRAVVADVREDGWPMKWQDIPEGAAEETIVPRDITPPGTPAGTQVFDTGKIVSGWPRIRLPGIPGVTVQMRYAEDLEQSGFVKHHVCNEKQERHYDRYTMRGDAAETWEPDLSYKAFRYVEITGYPDILVPGDHVDIVFAHTDLACEGRFRCSDEMLNRLFEAAVQTQKNNVLGQTVDCPHREQAQYLADSDLQAELLLYNFDSHSMLEKVLADFADSQLEDGTFPFVYPTNNDHPDFHLQIPEWDLHYCTLWWKLYWSGGDIRVLERYYDTAKRMVDYYFGTADSETGLVPVGKGWHISDWPYPTVDHGSPFLTVQNVKLVQAARIVADAAGRIGRSDDGESYARLADGLGRSIVRYLYDAERKRFVDCLGSANAHQGVNGLALHAGLVPEADERAVAEYVAGKEWEARTVLSLPMLRALFEYGEPEAAFRLIARREYPGWGYMIGQGATTLWEGWNDIESHCHAWNGYPIRLLQEYVTGVRAIAPGFAEVSIRPFVPEGLRFAEACVTTVRGPISVRWERTGQATGSVLRLSLDIPASTKAKLSLDRVPIAGSLSVAKEGSAEAAAFSGREMELASGKYELLLSGRA
ncbi:alpha-L-rhamnosidase [Paenibacillus flagellatus]|uniref:alpha-L-rhamnosidase n=1 Tax=Paenibacillus flagellatus TaxID=2211139 RepID=A0A2V5K5W7_9BACL|nr:alpha-L-rhamnosidase [Paenibacillus flagellatus]PYI53163.1 alpha-L-rhamnosidase [Paenibacillus flagellatus]